LESLARGGSAGFKDLGVGILLGLYDWRIDSTFMQMHAGYIRKQYWKSRINFSFPRIRPAGINDFQPPYNVTDKNLTQLIMAVRICFPDSGLSLSTRESALFRNNLAALGITQISAGSKTMPGGYSDPSAAGQFEISDERSPFEVCSMLKKKGLEPVFKDWDNHLKN